MSQKESEEDQKLLNEKINSKSYPWNFTVDEQADERMETYCTYAGPEVMFGDRDVQTQKSKAFSGGGNPAGFCRSCGSEILSGENFCSQCGARILNMRPEYDILKHDMSTICVYAGPEMMEKPKEEQKGFFSSLFHRRGK